MIINIPSFEHVLNLSIQVGRYLVSSDASCFLVIKVKLEAETPFGSNSIGVSHSLIIQYYDGCNDA